MTSRLEIRADELPGVHALMTAAEETMSLPGRSHEKSQGSAPIVVTVSTNGIDAGDNGSVKPFPRECSNQLSPDRIKVLARMSHGV